VDTSGNAYVIGLTISTNFPTTAGAFQPTLGGGYDAYVTKFNSTGTGLVYSTYLGGSGTDQGFGIAVDSAGNAYVTGLTSSANFPTANPFQAALGGGNDAFVAKLNPTGSALVFSTYLGGSGNDQGLGIAVDSAGNVYLKGDTGSSNFPTASPFQAALGGGTDIFVTKLNPTGSALVYSSYLGGSGTDVGHGLVSAIALDSSGNVYVTGDTSSTNFPTVNPIQAAFGGAPTDAFVAKIGQIVNAQPPTITKAFGDASISLGSDTSLTFTLNNPNLTTALSGVSFTDPLPPGLIVGTPNGLTGSCGGTVTATPDSSSITLSGGMLAANSGCTFSVTVTGQMVGSWLNTTEAVSSTESGNGDTASASITVEPPPPNCHGLITSQLAQANGGLRAAAQAGGYESLKALQSAIRAFCKE
jgi:Beta-propeller repeat